MPERSQDWFKQARRDLDVAKEMARDGFYEWACFVAQQGAEKALKAVFQKMGALAWGHSVFELLKILGKNIPVAEQVIDSARVLNRYYIPSCYPSGWSSGSPMEYFIEKEADDALVCARRILEFCESLLAREGETS